MRSSANVSLSTPFISLLFLLFLSALLNSANGRDFTITEATVDDIQRAFTEKKLTSRQLVDHYIARIEALNPVLRSIIEVNPDARNSNTPYIIIAPPRHDQILCQNSNAKADHADRQREGWCDHDRRMRSKLHGVPVLLKDSINTKDKMNTTVGSYVLLGSTAGRDATVVERLRKAGAVIIGKASMSEWYNVRSQHIPEGWCPRTGQGVNPYASSGSPGGSSSGSAISIAANMVAVSLGTETDGSILAPSDLNSVVGIKPTVGLTSRAGVVPISPTMDSIGPICRTVSDAVHVLDAIVGFDPRDYEATKEASTFIPAGGYLQFLKKHGLNGKRIGVVRNPFLALSNRSTEAGTFDHHLKKMRKKGATIVEDLEISNIEVILNPFQSGEALILLAQFKLALKGYLENELITSPVRSLSDVIAFINNNPDLESTEEYPQELFLLSEMTNGIGEQEKGALELMQNLSKNGFEKLIIENKLDAVVTPGSNVATFLAIEGYPAISVPSGYEDTDGMPFGICFSGLKGSEPKLIEIAYGFEQATLVRKPPALSILDF